MPAASLVNAGIALCFATLRVVAGYRPPLPSISQTAARHIATLLPTGARIAEFGSGLSTIWFARHFAEVVAIEHEPNWAQRISDKIAAEKLSNVAYLVKSVEDYETALDAYPDGYFDLVLVDGLKRDLCLQQALPKLKPGGYVYVDNTDSDLEAGTGEMRRTEAMLLNAVQASGGAIDYFTDFAPINFFAEQGALARIGKRLT